MKTTNLCAQLNITKLEPGSGRHHLSPTDIISPGRGSCQPMTQ